MALMSCPECTEKVSDRAYWCPHCGFPVREYMDSLLSNHNSTNMSISDTESIRMVHADNPNSEIVDDEKIVVDETINGYIDFLKECTVGQIETTMAVMMIKELRQMPNISYTLWEIASMPFNTDGDTYIAGLETISSIIYHACVLDLMETESIGLQLIDNKCKELQRSLQERMEISYVRRDGQNPVIVGIAGDKYRLTEKGQVLLENIMKDWFASECKGKEIDWEYWQKCYNEYVKKYDMYDDCLFADLYIDNRIFEIIDREEKVFYKKLENHILETRQILLKELTEERRHKELMTALMINEEEIRQQRLNTMRALSVVCQNLNIQNRVSASYVADLNRFLLERDKTYIKKHKSVIGGAIIGNAVAGPVGAIIGAMNTMDKNINR